MHAVRHPTELAATVLHWRCGFVSVALLPPSHRVEHICRGLSTL